MSVEVMIEHPCVEQLGHIALQKFETLSDLPITRDSASETKVCQHFIFSNTFILRLPIILTP